MRQKILIGVLVVLVAFIVGLFSWRYFQFRKIDGTPLLGGLTKEKTVEAKLDGTQVNESAAKRRPLAVVIENHTDARPQSGLSDASIVYEAIAEGGITRFLAIFGPHLPQKVGPVRSARTFFVEWVLDYDALFGHVGGSKDGLALVRSTNAADLDQFALGARAYQREPRAGIATEHTMFGFPEKLYQAARDFKKFSITDGKISPWLFKNEPSADLIGAGQTVVVDFGQPSYKATWSYDKATNSYLRNQNGGVHKDAISGRQLAAKNLVLMEVTRISKTFEDAKSVFEFDLAGTGNATVFQDGKQIDGTWKKSARGKRQIFLDSNGSEIKMNRGATWIEVVNPDSVKTEIKALLPASPTP
ncbi:DUF3048 domain-containing protein [Candidatus Berkelbacteria bacterium]|nr:DUF3048 domain-containing protein [Candidatus Berkelbacteria bacterium]